MGAGKTLLAIIGENTEQGPVTAFSWSADANTIFADLPPSSIVTGVRFCAARVIICFPVSVPPVNEIRAMPACALRAAPVTAAPLTAYHTVRYPNLLQQRHERGECHRCLTQALTTAVAEGRPSGFGCRDQWRVPAARSTLNEFARHRSDRIWCKNPLRLCLICKKPKLRPADLTTNSRCAGDDESLSPARVSASRRRFQYRWFVN